MRPDERLPTKRTESIGSRVPPAVTSTLSPSIECGAKPNVRPEASRSARSISSKTCAGSASRPTPHSPFEASLPSPGGTMRTPRSRSVSTLPFVAGCSYMRSFMAGATTSGALEASAALVRRLSARPVASLAIVLADAGTTASTSQRRTSSR